MDKYIAYILTILAFLALYGVLAYLREKDKKLIIAAMTEKFPDPRDMDLDLKWLNHLIEKECTNVEKMILIPRHRNKGGFVIITDDVYNEAIVMTSKNVLMRMSKTQFKILEFYVGDEKAIQGYIISRITEYLRDVTEKLNNKTISITMR